MGLSGAAFRSEFRDATRGARYDAAGRGERAFPYAGHGERAFPYACPPVFHGLAARRERAGAACDRERHRGGPVDCDRMGVGMNVALSNVAVAPSPIAISFADLTLGYERHPAVHHLSGEIRKGDLLAVVGPNGAGKSTLLKGIMGELRPLGGHLDLNGARGREIAYLPQ